MKQFIKSELFLFIVLMLFLSFLAYNLKHGNY